MLEEFRKNYNLVRILLLLLIIAVGSYVLNLAWNIIGNFLDILIILVIAWLVSFILEPIVIAFEKFLNFSRLISTIITYLLISFVLVLFGFLYIPVLTSQIETLAQIIPSYLNMIPLAVDWNASVTSQINNSITLVPSIAQFLFSSLIVLILSFYFIVDEESINKEFFNLVPKEYHNILHFTQKTINDTFVSFLRVQLFFGLSSGLLTWFILRILNVELAASIAFLSGLFGIIPLIGPFLAIIPPVFIALLTDPIKALIAGIFLLAMQQITFNIIGPKLLGKAFKLHPGIILISFLIGMKLAGGIGTVFAIPILGIGAIMIRRFGHYFLKINDDSKK